MWYYYFYYLAGACGRLEDGLTATSGLITRDELSPYLHGMFAILLTSRRDPHAPESAMRATGLESLPSERTMPFTFAHPAPVNTGLQRVWGGRVPHVGRRVLLCRV